jgi:hypothetical protein
MDVQGPAATKYRKGACENCGAMTHTKKDCTARPRKIGAKYKPVDLQPDERIIPEVPLNYDGKRDRWNGYDPEDYRAVMERTYHYFSTLRPLFNSPILFVLIVYFSHFHDGDESLPSSLSYTLLHFLTFFSLPRSLFNENRI